jgi:hypothetical protein
MMAKKMLTLADMPSRPRLEGEYGHDTKLFKSIDDWVNGGANDHVDDPEGTMRLGVNLNASHHIALQMAAHERRSSIAKLIEEMVEQMPEYQKLYGSKS